jgi:hypothetical protein
MNARLAMTTPELALDQHGLLLLQDPSALSLATLVAGDVVKGSWWGHPKAQEIFRAADALTEGGHTKTAKLVDGKVTFVHERLWPALIAVGTSRDAWQMAGLSEAARALLIEVKEGPVRSATKAAKELEARLLVDARQVHTQKGRHETELVAWPRPAPGSLDVATARALLEAAAKAIGADGRLPWQGRAKKQRS